MDECLEYSCCVVSGEDLGADPQCDLQSPTSILTGLPEMSGAREKKHSIIGAVAFFLSF